jgi:hypothetical protein
MRPSTSLIDDEVAFGTLAIKRVSSGQTLARTVQVARGAQANVEHQCLHKSLA